MHVALGQVHPLVLNNRLRDPLKQRFGWYDFPFVVDFTGPLEFMNPLILLHKRVIKQLDDVAVVELRDAQIAAVLCPKLVYRPLHLEQRINERKQQRRPQRQAHRYVQVRYVFVQCVQHRHQQRLVGQHDGGFWGRTGAVSTIVYCPLSIPLLPFLVYFSRHFCLHTGVGDADDANVFFGAGEIIEVLPDVLFVVFREQPAVIAVATQKLARFLPFVVEVIRVGIPDQFGFLGIDQHPDNVLFGAAEGVEPHKIHPLVSSAIPNQRLDIVGQEPVGHTPIGQSLRGQALVERVVGRVQVLEQFEVARRTGRFHDGFRRRGPVDLPAFQGFGGCEVGEQFMRIDAVLVDAVEVGQQHRRPADKLFKLD